MRRDCEMEEMQEKLLLLEEELRRLQEPPYTAGSVLEVGKKTVRVVTDSGGFFEVALPDNKGSGLELRKKLKKGAKIILNNIGAIVGNSEFEKPVGGEIVTVDEVYPDRLRVQVKGEPRLVLNDIPEVKVGDEIQLDRFGLLATERFDRKRTRYVLERVPQAPWSNIGGLESTISQIKDEVEEPFLHRDIFSKYGRKPAKGILLYGPPGCGKTMIAKSIAYNLAKLVGNGAGHFINVKGPEILDKFVGNSEANIRRIYAAAREEAESSKVPTVVFIDEADAVMKTRGKGISTDVYDSILPQFLTEMDGMNGDCEVITVLATNREDIIDPAVLRDGRVDRRIRVPRPGRKGTKEIFEIYLKGKPLQSHSVMGFKPSPEEVAEQITEMIHGDCAVAYNVVSSQGVLGSFGYPNIVSGAMIRGIVDRGCGYAIRREIDGGKKGLSVDDLCRATEEEFNESLGFGQSLVRDDWEAVFGTKGRQLYEAHQKGYLQLEKVNGKTAQNVQGSERRHD